MPTPLAFSKSDADFFSIYPYIGSCKNLPAYQLFLLTTMKSKSSHSEASSSSVNKRKRNEETSNEFGTLEKILQQNTRIMSKLDIIISNQKTLEAKVLAIEEAYNKNNDDNDTDFIKNIINKIAPVLLETSIYPNSDEFRNTTTNFINDNHKEFMSQFKRSDKWIIFYENNIATPLLEKHRSFRGMLSGKVKNAIMSIFKELPNIPTSSNESVISEWKVKPDVKSCFDKLFKRINNLGTETYISRIIQTVCKGKKKVTNIQIAFAISICELILDPNNSDIQINEKVIKPFLMKNLEKINKNENFYKEDDKEKEEEKIEEYNEKEKEKEGDEENEEMYDYQSSTDEETKEKMRKLKKQYKKT